MAGGLFEGNSSQERLETNSSASGSSPHGPTETSEERRERSGKSTESESQTSNLKRLSSFQFAQPVAEGLQRGCWPDMSTNAQRRTSKEIEAVGTGLGSGPQNKSNGNCNPLFTTSSKEPKSSSTISAQRFRLRACAAFKQPASNPRNGKSRCP